MNIPFAAGGLSATNPRKWRTNARNSRQHSREPAFTVAFFVTGR